MPDSTYAEITPRDWTDAKRIGGSLPYRVFRGQADAAWHLTTTIERAAQQFSVSPHWLPFHEQAILKGFKSRAHHYLQTPPADGDNVEWLSLIREYGGPTRLLDVTWSFYVAAFFAVEEATRDACVWAINAAGQIREALAKVRSESSSPVDELSYESATNPLAEQILADASKPGNGILLITPTRLSERQAIQKGVFLFPQNIKATLEQNLAGAFGYDPDAFSRAGAAVNLDGDSDATGTRMEVIKINLPKAWHREIILDLYRMNIDAASLFPGLDGFARSLKLFTRRNELGKGML